MTTPTQLERKVRQLDNDVEAVYEMLTKIQVTQTRHGNRLDELDQKVDGLHQRLEQHGQVLEQHGQVLEQHGQVLGQHGQKLDQIIELLKAR